MDRSDEMKRGEVRFRSSDKTLLQIALLIFSWCGVSAQEVFTVAGQGPSISGYADGTSATFNGPFGATLGSNGTLLIVADYYNFLLRTVYLPSGRVSTLAGTAGGRGSADGQGTSASFYGPTGVAVDSLGTAVLVADQLNYLIRHVTVSSGLVTTLAGSAGISGHADGLGTASLFNMPTGITVTPSGSLALVTDSSNNVLRVIDVSSGVVTTIAGSTTLAPGFVDGRGTAASFNGPTGVALNASGAVALIADQLNNAIRRMDLSSGVVTTVAGAGPSSLGYADGAGKDARFNNPFGIAVDTSGTVAVVCDLNSQIIRGIDLTTASVTTLAGVVAKKGFADGPSRSASFHLPSGVAVHATRWQGIAYIADDGNNAIRAITLSPPVPGSASSPHSNIGIIVGICVGAAAGLAVVGSFIGWWIGSMRGGGCCKKAAPSLAAEEQYTFL